MDSKLNRFKLKNTINSRNETISKVFLGEIDEETALLIMTKSSLDDSLEIPAVSNVIHQNDIFTSGTLESTESIKYSIIHPATETLIKKYTEADRVMVRETYDMYKNKILPLALEKGPNHLWIDNIFAQVEGHSIPCTTESNEQVLYLDEEFLICPDLKWDRKTMDSLYLLVLFKNPEIYTLRELTAEHIPLLQKIEQAIEKVLRIYNYQIDQTKVYFHYYPTFYRAHIHVSAITASSLGRAIGTSVLLHDVIDNLRISSDYYKKRTMEIVLSKGSYLYEGYIANEK
ncbi:m7GpppX diphosphatase [Nematocida minor]|uniref:m7GpppX diphosphatase n=1 Tax=Nematocida minor TaxID=1912983 RepID=UPI00221F01C3|nr:m7GpppX diphosphatase [Nematocida minor]KAI5189682.1 m7GpppX diphosphatase [Nematocida minor]